MKKLFTLVIVSFLSALAVQAQTLKVTKTDGGVVTYKATDISKIEFLPNETTPSGPSVLHEFIGYITMTGKMFTDEYYGNNAKIKVLKDGEKYTAIFTDEPWAFGTFDITLTGKMISGSGKMKIVDSNSGAVEEYEATMSGSMTNIKITIPKFLDGVVINWQYGTAPAIVKVKGSYLGKTQLKVGSSFGPFTSATVSYGITTNEDGTINVTASEEKYTGVTMMGNLTLGTYTVKNLAYDESSKSFVRDYSNDGIKVHFKAESMSIDKDYSFKAPCKMVVTVGENGMVTITNNYSLEHMPFPISAVYTGEKAK